jgi:hypothetical protein
VDELDYLNRLAELRRDVLMWRNLMALVPYAVHVDHEAQRAERARQESRERAARLLARIPTQRNREITPPRRMGVPRR